MLYTLITWEHASSAPTVREDLPLQFCQNMANNGGFYKVQIVNQESAAIETETKTIADVAPVVPFVRPEVIEAVAVEVEQEAPEEAQAVELSPYMAEVENHVKPFYKSLKACQINKASIVALRVLIADYRNNNDHLFATVYMLDELKAISNMGSMVKVSEAKELRKQLIQAIETKVF